MPFFSLFSSNIVFGICAIALLICTFTDGAWAEELAIKKDDFPSDFLFGAATSALQIEGSANKGGKGPSIWDNFVKLSDKVKDGSNITTAIDSYNRYKEDVKLLKELGVDSYRFSIAWTRILPNGSLSGGINQEGIDYYNNLIDELIKNGIEPLVTIFHFDFPQALQDKYGGFLSKSIVDDFVDYCEVCFLSFGDRVKHWITINEPLIIARFGHELGKAPPGRCSMPMGVCPDGNSATEPYIVSHNILLAHAAAARLYKENFQVKQHGEIGIALAGQHSEPYSESPKDIEATERSLDFYMGWYLDPLVNGDYPSIMRKLVKERLPIFTEEEKEKVKGSFDFIGINYYTSRYAQGQPVEPNAKPISFTFDTFTILREEKNGKVIGELAEGSDYILVYPKGLQNLLQHIKKKYKSPKIYITENGVNEARNDDRELNESLNDQHRIKFIKNHLYYANEAIKNGVNVKGYFYWSLFDNFELWDGYTVRFGLYYVDYQNNLERIPKQSAMWYRDFLHSNQ